MERHLYILPRALGFLSILSFLGACNSCQLNNQTIPNMSESQETNLVIETVVSGLEVPWSLAFAKDGRLFVSERPGRIRLVANGKLNPKPIYTVKDVFVEGEAGLMGLTLDPDFSENQFIYICYTTKPDDVEVRVTRLHLQGEGIDEEKVIIAGIPGNQVHVGCRLMFGPDNKLYITTGDSAKGKLSQQLDSLAGKTLRINADGSIPEDNPFVNDANARKEIWSLGHRNAQGIAFQPGSGLMFQTDHGPTFFDGPGGGDEVNIVEKGQNYGWPIVHHDQKKEGFVSPLLEYTPALPPAGAIFYRSSTYPAWTNNFFFTSLLGQSLIRVILKGRTVIGQEKIFKNRFGRLRDVAEGPDGALYLATSNRDGRGNPIDEDDRIIRVRLKR
jgi:glucose/arabinose dehydrogenase